MPTGPVSNDAGTSARNAGVLTRADALAALAKLEDQANKVNACKAEAAHLAASIRAREAALKVERAAAVLSGDKRPVEPAQLRADRARLAELEGLMPDAERLLHEATNRARSTFGRYLSERADAFQEKIEAEIEAGAAKLAAAAAEFLAPALGDRAAMEQVFRQDTHIGKRCAQLFSDEMQPGRGGLAGRIRAFNITGADALNAAHPLVLVQDARALLNEFPEE